MSDPIKPIQTRYKGHLFRSRLEARFAVFFDAMGIVWEYEAQGYELKDGSKYLPDFWLPEWEMFVEVKGQEPTDLDRAKARLLSLYRPVVVCVGLPDMEVIGEVCVGYDKSSCWLFGGELWNPTIFMSRLHVRCKQWSPSHWFRVQRFLFDDDGVVSSTLGVNGVTLPSHPVEFVKALVDWDRRYYAKVEGGEHPEYAEGWRVKGALLAYKLGDLVFDDNCYGMSPAEAAPMIGAINAAKSARFEYGQEGAS